MGNQPPSWSPGPLRKPYVSALELTRTSGRGAPPDLGDDVWVMLPGQKRWVRATAWQWRQAWMLGLPVATRAEPPTTANEPTEAESVEVRP